MIVYPVDLSSATWVIGGSLKGTYLYNADGQLVSRAVTNTTPSGTVHVLHDLNGKVGV